MNDKDTALRAALEPFAKAADQFGHFADHHLATRTQFTAGDLRRAKAALAALSTPAPDAGQVEAGLTQQAASDFLLARGIPYTLHVSGDPAQKPIAHDCRILDAMNAYVEAHLSASPARAEGEPC